MAEKEKFDKLTTYINAFKVAGDELSKLNLDTNDNGIEIKKGKKGEDEVELTSGQKSLVWEASGKELAQAVANLFGVPVENIELDNSDTIFIDGIMHTITDDKDRAERYAKEEIEDSLQDYIFDLDDTDLTIKDFIELFVEWNGNNPELDISAITSYILDKNPELMNSVETNGKTYFII